MGASYATEHKENDKIYCYRKLSWVDADDPDSFIPFAKDASGRLGARASAFLGTSLQTHPALELGRNLKHTWMPLLHVIMP